MGTAKPSNRTKMISIVTAALGFTAGLSGVATPVTRAPAPVMGTKELSAKFCYTRPKKGLSASFAANMGDCAQIVVADGYKKRIDMATPSSHFSSFLYDPPSRGD